MRFSRGKKISLFKEDLKGQIQVCFSVCVFSVVEASVPNLGQCDKCADITLRPVPHLAQDGFENQGL